MKPGSSATIINSEGTIQIVTRTEPVDSLSTSTSGITYNSKFDLNGWVWGNVSANKDSTSISLKYKDKFDIVLGEEKQGFLGMGKAKPFAEITSHNPYTSIKTFRTYEVESKRVKKIGIGPGVYYGVGTGFVPQVFVGIGIQLNLIRI